MSKTNWTGWKNPDGFYCICCPDTPQQIHECQTCRALWCDHCCHVTVYERDSDLITDGEYHQWHCGYGDDECGKSIEKCGADDLFYEVDFVTIDASSDGHFSLLSTADGRSAYVSNRLIDNALIGLIGNSKLKVKP